MLRSQLIEAMGLQVVLLQTITSQVILIGISRGERKKIETMSPPKA